MTIGVLGTVGVGGDDTAAINKAEAWLSTSTINRPRHLVIDVPVRYTQKNKLGTITPVDTYA